MTQKDRDRLVALKKARNGLIRQREAAAEIGQSERHVRRLLVKLKSVVSWRGISNLGTVTNESAKTTNNARRITALNG